jgi:hypothetical protein
MLTVVIAFIPKQLLLKGSHLPRDFNWEPYAGLFWCKPPCHVGEMQSLEEGREGRGKRKKRHNGRKEGRGEPSNGSRLQIRKEGK